MTLVKSYRMVCAAALLTLLISLTGCDQLTAFFMPHPSVELLTTNIIAEYPHDPAAFTEGLFYANGHLYESTGRNGQSSLREVDVQTGAVVRHVDLPANVFGEGIALVNGRIWQWTWRDAQGYIYDDATFNQVGSFTFTGEGWGMCYDGTDLYTSDGTAQITRRSADNFDPLSQITVTRDGQPITQINELECVGDSIYSNVWFSDDILRIDKATGIVTAVIDGSHLLPQAVRAPLGADAVLNGIAYNPDTDTFYVTGKLWPELYEVQFVPQQ